MVMPATSTLFKSNRSQAVRLPKDLAFPEDVKKVVVRRIGDSVVLTPLNALWDDFFNEPGVDLGPRDQPAMQERDWSL
jgi:antitoxin VapB